MVIKSIIWLNCTDILFSMLKIILNNMLLLCSFLIGIKSLNSIPFMKKLIQKLIKEVIRAQYLVTFNDVPGSGSLMKYF